MFSYEWDKIIQLKIITRDQQHSILWLCGERYIQTTT